MKLLKKKSVSLVLAAVMTLSSAGFVYGADGTEIPADENTGGAFSEEMPPETEGPGPGDMATESNDMATESNIEAISHEKYINGFEDGTVRPDKELTRAEATQMIYNLNIIPEPPAEDFHTSPLITRGEFSDMLIAAKPELQLSDILTGYPDGSLGLERGLTRAEAVTMINRVLDRGADESAILMGRDIRVMPDVTTEHWAYKGLVEAMMAHACTYNEDGSETWVSHEPGAVDLAEGWHNINGELFHVNEESLFDYNTMVDELWLDENGRYVTNDYRLDPLLTAEIQKMITSEMTQLEKLRAVYDYMMANYSYRGADQVEPGATGWENDMAVEMLQSGKGNCYSWAATFTYLARKCGYNAQAISGEGVTPKGTTQNHAWTEITIDGVPYTFDPEIEGVYAKNNNESYDLFMQEYDKAAWKYIKPEAPSSENPDGSIEEVPADEALSAIIDQVYVGTELAGREDMSKMALTSDMEMYALGTMGVDYKAGVISEPMMTSIAHSVVLMEVNEGVDIEAAKQAIKENVDPFKWVCVGVSEENVLVENYGNYIILIMDDNSQQLMENFLNVMQG